MSETILTFDEWYAESGLERLDITGRDLEDGYAWYLQKQLGRCPTYAEVKQHGKINSLTTEKA